MSRQSKYSYEFGPFRLDVAERRLRRDAEPVPLTPKAFDTLLTLVENTGHVLGKDELMKRVWPDTIVEEANLAQTISMLRKALGESSEGQKYIETIPKWGYRFLLGVRKVTEAEDVPQLEAPGPSLALSDKADTLAAAATAEEERNPAGSLDVLPTAGPRGRRRWVGWAGLALLVGLAVWAGYLWRGRFSRPSDTGETIRSLAVLPLENLSGNPAQEYFADGMTDTLITNLAQIGALRVVSRTSAMVYKGTRKPLPEIARALNVEAVVEGSVLRSGDRVRITVKLIHAATDRHLWTTSYERDLDDVLALQNELAKAIAQEIKIKLAPQDQVRLTNVRPVPRAAYDAYLKGRYHFWHNWTRDSLKKSVEYFQQALEKDPEYAEAYAGIAESYILLGAWVFLPPKESFPHAKAAATRALSIDDTLAEAHNALGAVKMLYEWDLPGAEREYQRAIECNPGYANAHNWYGYFWGAMGRREASIAEHKRAQELDPLSLVINWGLGAAFYYAGQYDEALAQARKVIDMNPNFWPAHQLLGFAYEEKRMYAEAIVAFRKAVDLSGKSAAIVLFGHAYAVAGKRKEAEKVLDELNELSQRGYVTPWGIAAVYAGLEEKDQAFEWLNKAYEERDQALIWLKASPRFNNLHSDPRFADLLRRIGLPP